MDKLFDSLSNSIIKPMTDLEFYKHISVLSSTIKDGHTKFSSREGNYVISRLIQQVSTI
ncbi:MAG: hypothetical protein IPP27_14400 [Bacteroidetes bacterium]|nr:hypothetical protein [Bacteroidota bacterium]